jgi:hypothetical protein
MMKIGDVLNFKNGEPEKRKDYWLGNLPPKDDFGVLYSTTMYDGKTIHGPWANMTPKSWRVHGCGRLGTGYGQKYEKQENGRWLKVEG